MRNINTQQIDNHCWKIEVTDGYHTQWTAVLSGSILDIRLGERTGGKIQGTATVKAKTEGEAIGIAMQLVFNWDQFGSCSNELLDEKDWVVVRKTSDGWLCLVRYPNQVTEISFDNDLGSGPEGIELLTAVLEIQECFPNLKTISIHSGNLRRVADMRKLLRGSNFKVRRRVPYERVFPRSSNDPRVVTPYRRNKYVR